MTFEQLVALIRSHREAHAKCATTFRRKKLLDEAKVHAEVVLSLDQVLDEVAARNDQSNIDPVPEVATMPSRFSREAEGERNAV